MKLKILTLFGLLMCSAWSIGQNKTAILSAKATYDKEKEEALEFVFGDLMTPDEPKNLNIKVELERKGEVVNEEGFRNQLEGLLFNFVFDQDTNNIVYEISYETKERVAIEATYTFADFSFTTCKAIIVTNTKGAVLDTYEFEIDDDESPHPNEEGCPCSDGCAYNPFNTLENGITCETKELDFGETDLEKGETVYVYDFLGKGNRLWKVEKKVDKKFWKKEWTKGGVSRLNLNDEKLKPTDNLRVKIVNVNRYLYDVSLNDSLFHYDTQMPQLFKELFYPDSSEILSNLLSSIQGGASFEGFTFQATGNNEEKDNGDCLPGLVCEFFDEYYDLNARIIQAYNVCTCFPDCAELDGDVGMYYKSLLMKVKNIQNIIACEQSGLSGKFGEKQKIEKELEANNAKKEKKQFYQRKINELKIKEAEEKDANKKEGIKVKKGFYEDSLSKVSLLSEADVTAKSKRLGELNSSLKYNTALIKILESLPSEEVLRKKQMFVNNMTSQNNLVQLDYVNLGGDELKLNIKVEPKTDLEFVGALRTVDLSANIPIKRRASFSFSQGVFLSLYNGQNTTYTWQEMPAGGNSIDGSTPNEYQLLQEGTTAIPVGFCALGSFNWGHRVKIGISAGPGITLERSARIAYLAGGSLTFSDRRLSSFVITAGVAGMNTNRLTENYALLLNQDVIFSGSNPPTITYYNEFKPSFFMSATYAFSWRVYNSTRSKRTKKSTGSNGEGK